MQTKNPYLSTFHNNPQEFYATKIHKHKVCGYSLFTHCSFDRNGNKYDFYRGEDPMKKLPAEIKEHLTEVISCEKKNVSSDKETRKEKQKTKNLLQMQ